MKHVKPLLFPIACLIVALFTQGSAFGEKVFVHPANKQIMKNYLKAPWPYELKWPEVPRIWPHEGLRLFKSGRTILIDADHKSTYDDTHVPGAINISEDKLEKIRPGQINSKGKIILVYCN